MSEKECCGNQDFSKYDDMTTEELEEILRLDAEKPEGQETDEETLFYIMGVLTERRKKNGQTGNTAQEAYEIFKQYYMPEIDNIDPAPAKENKPKILRPRWMRRLVAAAAAIAILIGGSVTAKAFGIDVWKAVVQWTQETFHFGDWGSSGPNSDLAYDSLQEVLQDNEITEKLVPTWLPEEYQLDDITITNSPKKDTYRATYVNGDQVLRITVQNYLDGVPVYVEQGDGLVEEYKVAGITYYLFDNYDNTKAVWVTGSYECYISGNVTIQELKQMIDSIEKG